MSRNFLIEAYQKLRRKLQLGSSHSGEDALNDAFCQLWAGCYDPASVNEGEKLLSTAVYHRQISLWRKENKYKRASLEDVNIAEPPPDNEETEVFWQIRKLIETQLTPLQQDILTRHDINDESYREIANSLGMQETTIRMQLSRARKIIRETYKKTKK